jgi:hypothetical protein
MLVYLLIFLFAAFIYFKQQEQDNFILFYVFAFFYVFISGFRDMIGGSDVYIYGEVYEVPMLQLFSFDKFEKGFLLYYAFLKQISDDRYFLFIITALIMALLHFRAIKRYSPLVYFSLFIFFCKFFLMSFIYLRQGLAMGILWLTLPYIKEKKYFQFFVLVFIAYFLHRSAIIFLPIVFFVHYKFKTFQFFIITFVLIIIVISPIGTLLSGFFSDQLESEKLNAYVAINTGLNYFYLFEVVLLTVLALNYREEFYKNRESTIVFNGLVGYIFVTIIGLTNATFVRFSWYYFIFLVLALPYMYNYISDLKQKRLFKNLVFLYFSLLFFNLLINFDSGDLMPYKSIFQDFPRNGRFDFMEYRTK